MKAIDYGKVRNILIRSVNWIGDAVMTVPALDAIRRQFPRAEITLLANPLVAQLFSPHDAVDRVLVFDRKLHRGVLGRFRLAAELRRHSFDLAILFPNSFEAALIPWLAGIPLRLGKKSDGRSLLLSHGFPPRLLAPDDHQVLNYLTMLNYFGIEAVPPLLHLRTTAAEDQQAAELLAAHGIGATDLLLGINPGATYGSAKRWYPDRFAQVAGILAQRRGCRVVVFGGPGETAMAGEIEQLLGGHCLNVAGATTVRQLLALIKRCNFFITNDSGPMHIAAAFGVPLVAVFGSTDHRTTSPYFDRGVIVRKDTVCAPCMKRECPTDHRCMTAITAADVVAAAEKLMAAAALPGQLA